MNQPQAQPPSGGCVLKQAREAEAKAAADPAAFGRLCVETKRQPILRAANPTSRLRAAVC